MTGPDLRVVLDEEQEDHVLPLVLDGQVQGVVCMGLEHVIEQRSTELSKVLGVQIILQESEVRRETSASYTAHES